MKRGRPSVRSEVQKEIIETLSATKLPMTISGIAKSISAKLGRKVSWNTVEKYMESLIAMDRVAPITLPHSKQEGKDGLVVYSLKK